MKKQAIIFWTAIILAGFAIVDGLFARGSINPLSVLIPVIIFGIVFILYKYPPKKYRKRSTPKVKPSARTMAKVANEFRKTSSGTMNGANGTNSKRKHYPFQVIDGQKGKNDDDYPKYH